MAKPKPYDLKRHLPSTAFVLIMLAIIAGFAGVFVYAGIYNIGADAPHSRLVYDTLDALRERSIAAYSKGIRPPADLASPARVASGASLYQEMCTGCHLGPGLEKSEMSQGLYPPAPELAKGSDRSPAQQFWIIKHGVKLSAMPAWGKTHNDQLIWDMVAFVRQLPRLSPQQYRALVASAPAGHDEMMRGMEGMQGMRGMHDRAGSNAPADADAGHPAGHSHAPK